MKKLFNLSVFVLSIFFITGCQIETSISNEKVDNRSIDIVGQLDVTNDDIDQETFSIVGVWQDQNVDMEEVELIIENYQLPEEVTLSVSKFLVLNEISFHSYFNIILSGDSDLIESNIIYPLFSNQGESVTEKYLERIKKENSDGEVIYDLSYSNFGQVIIEDGSVGMILEGGQSIGVTWKLYSPQSKVDTLSWSINNDQLLLTLNEKVDTNSDVENIVGSYTRMSDKDDFLLPEIVKL